MNTPTLSSEIKAKAEQWTRPPFDEETRTAVRNMLENDPQEVEESFYRDLEFGTGGLRGIMGYGTNRMNKYTVGMATQGLANYLRKSFPGEEVSAAIAYDCRNNNTLFADITASVLSANGVKVYVFDGLRPTPELSFAIRQLGCKTGIVITASHNPKEYNGYKVYWEDGGQLVPPHDKNVIEEVKKVGSADINFNKNEALIHNLGEDMDQQYLDAMVKYSLSPDIIQKHSDLGIVFTPIHGTGVDLVPRALKSFGFTNIINVPEQDVVSGDFPTVHSPNPEESAALELALKKADKTNADLVMATDPDSDRVGIAVRDNEGRLILLNGNQTASLLVYYLIRQWDKKGKLDGRQFIAKTIVTTDLLGKIAEEKKVEVMEVLTGFKYIAEVIKNNEGSKTFIGGGEESYGYLVGDYVRDKDAVISCAIIAETAAWAREQGMTLYQLLLRIYREYGLYYESLLSITRKGKKGAEEIQEILRKFREESPEDILGEKVVRIIDYLSSEDKNIAEGTNTTVQLPKSNVLQFITDKGSKVTIRPSGTEPKIKFYFGVKADLEDNQSIETALVYLKAKTEKIKADLGLG